jgi:hypothetical protein
MEPPWELDVDKFEMLFESSGREIDPRGDLKLAVVIASSDCEMVPTIGVKAWICRFRGLALARVEEAGVVASLATEFSIAAIFEVDSD